MPTAPSQEESTVTAAMERDMAAARGSGGGKSGRRSAVGARARVFGVVWMGGWVDG